MNCKKCFNCEHSKWVDYSWQVKFLTCCHKPYDKEPLRNVTVCPKKKGK